jgi:hypothetical protein
MNCTCYFCYSWGQKSCLSKPCSSERYPLGLGRRFDQIAAKAKEGIMASIWKGQNEKEKNLLAWRRPLHQWHQSHISALRVLGPESITSLPVEHPWGDKHEAKYQFTYTKTVWWLRCCCIDWNTLVPWWNVIAYAWFSVFTQSTPCIWHELHQSNSEA